MRPGGGYGGRYAEAQAGGAGAWGRGPACPEGTAGRAALVWQAEPWTPIRSGAGAPARPARSPAVAAWEVWKSIAPWASTEEGRRGSACSLPLAGILGQFAGAALGNLLTGKLGTETNASVLEELRVTSLGVEALFSFPAPCPTSADLAKEGCVTSSGPWAGSLALPGAGLPETKVKEGRADPSQAQPSSQPRAGGSHFFADPLPPRRGFLLGDPPMETSCI